MELHCVRSNGKIYHRQSLVAHLEVAYIGKTVLDPMLTLEVTTHSMGTEEKVL